MSYWSVPTGYAVAAVAPITLVVFLRAIFYTTALVTRAGRSFFKRHLHYPLSYYPVPFFGRPRRIVILSGLLYVTANALCATLGTKSRQQIFDRVNELCLSNVALQQLLGIAHVAYLARISFAAQSRIRAWICFVVLAQATAHITYMVVTTETPKLSVAGTVVSMASMSPAGINAYQSASSLAMRVLLSAPALQRRFFEPLNFARTGLTVSFLVSLWFHVGSNRIRRLYLIVAAAAWGADVGIRRLSQAYCSFAWRRHMQTGAGGPPPGLQHAQISLEVQMDEQTSEFGTYLVATVYTPRCMLAKPGQYIYLTVPGASHTALFQRHPFFIQQNGSKERGEAGVDTDSDYSVDYHKLVLLIKPYFGFTQHMQSLFHKSPLQSSHFALIEGPFGVGEDFTGYGTVLMMASGAGIISLLPYVLGLVRAYRFSRASTRRIRVHWYADELKEIVSLKTMMDDLLDRDSREYNLHVQVFFPHSYKGRQFGHRISAEPGEPDFQRILRAELAETRRGKTALLVSATRKWSDTIRDAAAPYADVLTLRDMEFQPIAPRRFVVGSVI